MAQATLEKAPWQARGAEKRETVRRMFADIAARYDFMNGLMSLSMHKRWRAQAVSELNLKAGDSALDVCCGTGDFLIPLARAIGPKGLAAGLDYCEPMVRIAGKKTGSRMLALGDACALPITSSSVDAVTVGWGLRNLADLEGGLREMVRVLKPGGRLVSLDMARPRNPVVRRMSNLVCRTVFPMLGAIFGKREAYSYLPKSTQSFASPGELKALFEGAGLTDVRAKDLFFGNICLHWGRKP